MPTPIMQPKTRTLKSDDIEVVQLPSKMESLLRGAAQGATLGFGDEIAGGAKALYDVATSDKKLSDLPDLYKKERDITRSNNDAAERAHDGYYAGGQLAGNLATAAVPIMNVGKGMSLAQIALRGAAQGGAVGLGNSKAKNVGDMLGDAAQGAMVGAAAAPIANSVSNLVPRLGALVSGAGKMASNPAVGAGIDKALEIVANNPDALGENYVKTLTDALARGKTAAAVTHGILYKRDPKYRDAIDAAAQSQ